ncbi:hypothetical protein DFH07DRAFT_833138 [Mycena maculata]|uniref:EF-hand domain-containing protein n=1 Tax=Mycena maculata TaxID=230809 RepID=A0AAD7IM29_9AGAR|nr:hypothetical protein DFH07DRAFT_833138 [Mycena maculata]
MSSTNDSFSALPQYLQHRIAKAFDESVPSTGSDTLDSGGGFVADTGGFLAEDSSQIPLSAIPTALQRLDLPPDDEQVLLKSSSNKPDEIGEEAAMYVSRDDWRSVCAVLLEHHAEEYEDSDGGADDEYQEPEPDSDSDEYVEGPSTSRRRTRMKRRARSSSSSASSISTPKKLTSRQTKTCLETYALLFPSASESELPNQRIMIKDVQRLSKLIGDTLKGEDIIEMLAEFSASPDKSMSFTDFGSMMVAAKLA